MRLFIAMEPDNAAKSALISFREALRVRGQGRYVRDEQLHLTLLFLGEVSPARLPEIKEAMGRAATAHAPVPLALGKPDMFRNIAVVHVDGRLQALNTALIQAMMPLGVSLEKRPFRPHITIARDIETAPADWPELSPIAWTPGEIVLFESRMDGRLRYVPLHRSPL